MENLAVLTGDIHTFFAGDVTTTGASAAEPVGVELVGGSATSLGIPEALGVARQTLQALAEANNPHVKYAEFVKRGYAVVEVEKKKMTAEFKSVDALTKGAGREPLKSFEVDSGDPTLHEELAERRAGRERGRRRREGGGVNPPSPPGQAEPAAGQPVSGRDEPDPLTRLPTRTRVPRPARRAARRARAARRLGGGPARRHRRLPPDQPRSRSRGRRPAPLLRRPPVCLRGPAPVTSSRAPAATSSW